jgi:hypothetical protein
MWEEHPDYQKAQARLIGLGMALIVIGYSIYAIVEQDWDLLRHILLFAGAFIFALALIFGFVWMLMKIFTRKRADDTKIEESHDA